jgi:stage II sporulation protein D
MLVKKRNYIIISLMVIIWIMGVIGIITPKTWAAFNDQYGFEIAAALLNKGNYLEALALYEEIAIQSDRHDQKARAHFFKGKTYSLYLDQFDEALNEFDIIINQYPQSPAASDAFFNKGVILFETNQYQKAYKIFQQYRIKYPRGIRYQSASIWAQSAKEQMQQALKPKPPNTARDPEGLKEKIPAVQTVSPRPSQQKIQKNDIIIRVSLGAFAKPFRIESAKRLIVTCQMTDQILHDDTGIVNISMEGNRVMINGDVAPSQSCRITTDQNPIRITGHRYRGFISIDIQDNRLLVVNHLPLEQYLYGVVPEEMPDSWSRDALMAQAIAARTYAVYIKRKSGGKAYDVEATTKSEVYGGYDAENPNTNAAVNATRDLIMIYNQRPIIAYFHSNSGGYTEDAKNVWHVNLPYLKGTVDHFSLNQPRSQWEAFVPYSRIMAGLNQYGLKIGRIDSLQSLGQSQSGRPLGIAVATDKGMYKMTSNSFRIKVGPDKIKSTLFEMLPRKNGILFKGKGYGHGVGMSQWGAKQMAQAGHTYKDILAHYYPGVQLTNIHLKN